MSEIRKVPKQRRETITQPRIVGAKPRAEANPAPKILDHTTKQKGVEIQQKDHSNRITIREHTRKRPKKSDPDVRLQAMTHEERVRWNEIKTNQWEPE